MAHYHHGWARGWKKSPRGDTGERFDSRWELQYMDELERDPLIRRWTRHHSLKIPYRKWWGARGYYEPDFLAELSDGSKELREVKGDHLFVDMNTPRKLRAGDQFCRERGMTFRVITKGTVDPGSWSPIEGITVTEGGPSLQKNAHQETSRNWLSRFLARWVRDR